MAELIQGHVRRLENLATGLDVMLRISNAKVDGEQPQLTAWLREIQMKRVDGDIDADVAFFLLCTFAEDYAENIFTTDKQLNLLSEKIRAVEKREGLGEFDEFAPDDPDAPADWKALDAESNHRYQEVKRIYHERLVSWLRRHGEFEMAELYLNDRIEFDRRREVGRCRLPALCAFAIESGLHQIQW